MNMLEAFWALISDTLMVLRAFKHPKKKWARIKVGMPTFSSPSHVPNQISLYVPPATASSLSFVTSPLSTFTVGGIPVARWRFISLVGTGDSVDYLVFEAEVETMRTSQSEWSYLQGDENFHEDIWPASMILSATGSPELCMSTVFCVSIALVNTCKRSLRNSEWLFDVMSRASRCNWVE